MHFFTSRKRIISSTHKKGSEIDIRMLSLKDITERNTTKQTSKQKITKQHNQKLQFWKHATTNRNHQTTNQKKKNQTLKITKTTLWKHATQVTIEPKKNSGKTKPLTCSGISKATIK